MIQTTAKADGVHQGPPPASASLPLPGSFSLQSTHFLWWFKSFSLPVVSCLFKSSQHFIATSVWRHSIVLQQGSLGTSNTCAFLFFLLFFFFFLLSLQGRPWSHVLIKSLWLFKIRRYCPIYLLNYAPIKKFEITALPMTSRSNRKGRNLRNDCFSCFPVKHEPV